ncbi:uncharacterized protein N7484_011985 [Penicillium longicatenatum]|uniref:uncharacterized protein n=1 Tax=Penicillium longicatenatum TaxID=1561947 RepID=UPI0025495A3E|nr:uncharacterized protein N7484_011985 [Penicillium longicatenatum]KAJ5631885.1 hypothetical protein N7484_011985 [Penicillium longicatenatum]
MTQLQSQVGALNGLPTPEPEIRFKSDISDEQRMDFGIKQLKLEVKIPETDFPTSGSICHVRDVAPYMENYDCPLHPSQ